MCGILFFDKSKQIVENRKSADKSLSLTSEKYIYVSYLSIVCLSAGLFKELLVLPRKGINTVLFTSNSSLTIKVPKRL